MRDATSAVAAASRFESSQLQVHHLVPFRNFEDPAVPIRHQPGQPMPACHRKLSFSNDPQWSGCQRLRAQKHGAASDHVRPGRYLANYRKQIDPQ